MLVVLSSDQGTSDGGDSFHSNRSAPVNDQTEKPPQLEIASEDPEVDKLEKKNKSLRAKHLKRKKSKHSKEYGQSFNVGKEAQKGGFNSTFMERMGWTKTKSFQQPI